MTSVLDQPEPATGNYFVSTYPPFSCWTEAATADFRSLLEHAPAGPEQLPLGLYVHIPFCIERCQYCYYLSHDERPQEIDGYLEAVSGELSRYARLPALAGRSLAFVYFGGGTPSILSAPRIERLMRAMQRAMPWTHVREASFECAPRSVTRDKLRVLADHGVTRISMGVQQMNDEVLQANGRVHLVADVERASEAIRQVGFHTTNLDLMVGLVGETDDSFLSSLERVIQLEPESITIYQLEIPLNTPLYRALRAGTVTDMASWDRKRARLGQGMTRLENAGYRWRSAYTAVRDGARHPFVYQDEQYRGADLLGVGTSAFSYLEGIHQQNRASLEGYLATCAQGELPQWRGHVLTEEERLVRETILQLKLGRIRRDWFRDRHGVDVMARFAVPLAEMQQRGWLEANGDGVTMTREGLLRVDRLVRAFYLPEHAGIRYS